MPLALACNAALLMIRGMVKLRLLRRDESYMLIWQVVQKCTTNKYYYLVVERRIIYRYACMHVQLSLTKAVLCVAQVCEMKNISCVVYLIV